MAAKKDAIADGETRKATGTGTVSLEIAIATLVQAQNLVRSRLGREGADAETIAIVAAAGLYRRRNGNGPGALALANAARRLLATANGKDVCEREFRIGLPLRDSVRIELVRDRVMSCFELLSKARGDAKWLPRIKDHVADSLGELMARGDSNVHAEATTFIRAKLDHSFPSAADELLRWAYSAVGGGTWLNAKTSARRKRVSRARARTRR